MSDIKMKITIKCIIPLFAFTSYAIADATITLSGTIKETIPICSINPQNHIVVDFGEKITTKKIIENTYIEKINLTVNCTDHIQNAMSLVIDGDPASFNGTLIKTSTEGLGIRISYDDKTVPPGDSIKFTYNSNSVNGGAPDIYASLVARDSTPLDEGLFEGTANIIFQYN